MAVSRWSDLHRDLLEEVATKLSEIEDFTAFRGVCASWRDAIKDKFVYANKIPLLMFPAKEGGDNNECEFYSWNKRKIFSKTSVPEAMGNTCIGVGFGWTLTVTLSSGELSLVNPMSSGKIQLHNMHMMTRRIINYPKEYVIRKAVLSANPSETSDFVLTVNGCLGLFFWRNGDNYWSNDIYFKYKLYGIDDMRDPYNLDDEKNCQFVYSGLPDYNSWYMRSYLVESSKGELLLIVRDGIYDVLPRYYIRCFLIDTVKKECKKIESLGGDAIFIDSWNSAICVRAADFPGVVEANCIYDPDDGRAFEPFYRSSLYRENSFPTHMRIYNVELERIAYEGLDVKSFSAEHPPLWLL